MATGALLPALSVAACGDDGATTGGADASGTITVQIGGEELATNGLSFPMGSEVVISDGWAIHFDHVLVTVGKVWLSEDPDTAPADQSKTGDVVAEVDGPWAVDLAKLGSVSAAGGEGTATPLTTIDSLNKKGGGGLSADERYAFSYDLIGASQSAAHVNFDDDDGAKAAYAAAVDAGCSVVYIGTATFKGATCSSSDDTYDFDAIPKTVPFTLCFDTPSQYLNCQNQENEGDPFPGEEYQRGIPIKANAASVAQLTIHMDHPFYSDVEHEPLLYFDQFAAQLVGAPADTELTMDALAGVDPTALTDGNGADLPWRSCDGIQLPDGTQRAFTSGSIPVGPSQDPAKGFRDYRDFVRYVQSAQGHLNGGEGLCYVKRGYPSPP